jgi:glycosyltransferase involved in cell wall biosynthesis
VLGIVIPAHNEARLIGAALAAAQTAAKHPQLGGEAVEVMVVLDSCSDATGMIASRAGVRTVSVRARNVGVARAIGAEAMLALGVRWLAFTDADSVVSPSWLVDQLALEVDAVCGPIRELVNPESWHCVARGGGALA